MTNKWTRLLKSDNKPKGTKIKTGFSWDNIGKVVDSSGGGEYTLTPVGKDKIRMVGKDQDHIFSARDVLSLLKIYDKQGNLVNDSGDYQ